MTPGRFGAITGGYPSLRIAVVGDFCLDRYLDIDPGRAEVSIETGLPVRNVVQVRAQPGGAGTVVNNLVALGIGTIHAVGFCGEDGEGYELQRSLAKLPGVALDHLLVTPLRRTFTYAKPMLCTPGQPARELERLDSKNWTATPEAVSAALSRSIAQLAGQVDGLIILDQVDLPETGVVTATVRSELARVASSSPALTIIADSRRGLRGYPPVIFKMNAVELAALVEQSGPLCDSGVMRAAGRLAQDNQRPVFITRAQQGIVGAAADGGVSTVPAVPVRGEIDVVGAGDCVTANLTAALCAGATVGEAMELAMLASSLVVHQLGTTGTASVPQIAALSDDLAK
jgi:rfaE bifunctional protein kinase chain/domain